MALINSKGEYISRGLCINLSDDADCKEVQLIYNNFKSLGEALTGDREFEEFQGKKHKEPQVEACLKMLGYSWERYEFLFVAYINFLIVKFRRKIVKVSPERLIEMRVNQEVQRRLEMERLQNAPRYSPQSSPSRPSIEE